MFDISALTSMIAVTTQATQAVQAGLTQAFTAGAAAMNLSGPAMMESVIGAVTEMNTNASAQLSAVMAGFQAEVDIHQRMQAAEKPDGYTTSTDDLRTTVSRGFPKEDPGFFASVPRFIP